MTRRIIPPAEAKALREAATDDEWAVGNMRPEENLHAASHDLAYTVEKMGEEIATLKANESRLVGHLRELTASDDE